MMKKRIISAVIMLLIFIPILILGNIPFVIFVTILGMLATFELLNLNSKLPLIIKILVYLQILILILFKVLNLEKYLNVYLLLVLLINLFLLVIVNNRDKYNYKDAFSNIGIILFIGLSFQNFIIVREKSMETFIYLLLIAIVNDIFALFIGKLFGKHKLAPDISPNKTIEGAIGGSIISTLIASLFYIFIINKTSNVYLIIIFTFVLTIIGQLGDLVKSSIKRYENIKDFSNLIPGHGGIIDRLDSIIFVSLTYILIMNLF